MSRITIRLCDVATSLQATAIARLPVASSGSAWGHSPEAFGCSVNSTAAPLIVGLVLGLCRMLIR